ncbi:MAG TPA: HAD hydrolase family protein [Verrucomicrobiae bacterium]
MPLSKSAQLKRLKAIRLFLCDVDGVLTDGTIIMGQGVELKRFSIQDGLGLRLLQKEGIKVGWISNRPSTATIERAKDLKVDYLHQQKAGTKTQAAEDMMKQAGVTWEQVCYMGDDIVDLAVLKRAGFAAAVANAIAEAKDVAHYVTKAPGGDGALREVCEMILKAQGYWKPLVEEYSR